MHACMRGVLVTAELNPDTHVGSWASVIMTFADKPAEILLGPTQPTLEALKASYASKPMADWMRKAPQGSMLACCTDSFTASFRNHFNLSEILILYLLFGSLILFHE
jgi:hypothetical protein